MTSHHNLCPVGGIQAVEASKIEVDVKWDFSAGQMVDVDLSCVVVNDVGNLIDCVFYNHLKLDDNSIIHSGDNKIGSTGTSASSSSSASSAPQTSSGDGEMITIDLMKLPSTIKCLVLMVNCYSGGNFSVLETATAALRNAESHEPLIDLPPIGSLGQNTGLILAILFRNQSSSSSSSTTSPSTVVGTVAAAEAASSTASSCPWLIKNISSTCVGRNFKECEPHIRREMEFVVSKGMQQEGATAPDANKVFELRKGGPAFGVPSGIDGVFMGLGWDISDKYGGTDVDASVLLFSNKGGPRPTQIVYFGNKEAQGVSHGGDNLTGAGEGDDEILKVDFAALPSEIGTLIFVVNIYTMNCNFSMVEGCFCRLVDSKSGHELCRYSLKDMWELSNSNAMVMCSVHRNTTGNGWEVVVIIYAILRSI